MIIYTTLTLKKDGAGTTTRSNAYDILSLTATEPTTKGNIMDNSSTKKKRGRPSKGLSEYGRVSARLTEEQYRALVDYGLKHNIVDKNGALNPSEVVRVAIDNLTSTIDTPQHKADVEKLKRAVHDMELAAAFIHGCADEEDSDDAFGISMKRLDRDTQWAVKFLSTLLP